jgi:uncharacterized protein
MTTSGDTGHGHTHDRNGLRVLSTDECHELLAARPVGRVAFMLAGRPVVLPVNHAVDGDSIVFRTGAGSKLATSQREIGSVAFEVDAFDAEQQTGWSVLVQGSMSSILDLTEVARLDQLELAPWLETSRPHWVRIVVERISGRAIEHDRG